MKFYLFIILVTILQGCSNTGKTLEQLNEPHCKTNRELFTIQHHEKKALTICPINAPEDCHSDFNLQAYQHRQLDINKDGQPDEIVYIRSGLVGIDHDINYYAVFMACGNNKYQRVLFDALTTIEPTEMISENDFMTFKVTRNCHDSTSGQIINREYLIKYKNKIESYGPPNDDEGLRYFCGTYESSLPAQRQ